MYHQQTKEVNPHIKCLISEAGALSFPPLDFGIVEPWARVQRINKSVAGSSQSAMLDSIYIIGYIGGQEFCFMFY